MIYKSFVVFLSFCLAGLFLTSKPAFAAIRCETQYGGGETCVSTGELQIDKEVFDPENNKFVDNLGRLNAFIFLPEQEVEFKLTIKNVGDQTLTNIKVVDSLPGYLNLSGDSATSFTIDSLNPGDSFEKTIKTTVFKEKNLPSGIQCLVNSATVSSGSESDTDSAQFCVSRRVLGITTLPKTGSNLLIFASIFTVLSSLTGVALIKIKS